MTIYNYVKRELLYIKSKETQTQSKNEIIAWLILKESWERKEKTKLRTGTLNSSPMLKGSQDREILLICQETTF